MQPRSPPSAITHPQPLPLPSNAPPFIKEKQTDVLADGKVYCGYLSLKHLTALLEAERKVKIQFYNYTMTIIAEQEKKNHSSVS